MQRGIDRAGYTATVFDLGSDPMQLVREWLGAARDAGERLPEAMTLATVTLTGWPAARVVMLRAVDRGLVFFTDGDSDKGRELAAQPRAATVLHWLVPEHRQVRLVGGVETVAAEDADDYWSARRPEARRSAAASVQSQVIPSRTVLEERVKDLIRHYPDGIELPRPERWIGYRVVPTAIEFWEEAADGLHERIRYRRAHGVWDVERLSP